MNCKHFQSHLFCKVLAALLLVLLASCGGGEVSRFVEPTQDIPGEPGTDIPPPPPGTPLELLPKVSGGGLQFADPNVLIRLNGSVEAAPDSVIVSTLWTQTHGTPVTIPNPRQLVTSVLVPDLETEEQLSFRLTVQDSEGRFNAATTSVVVRPIPVFMRVVGGVVNEADETAVFSVRLSAPQEAPLSVNFATSDGSAQAGSDYIASEGTLTFAAGETVQEVAVSLLDSDVAEDNEYFSLNVSVVSQINQSSNSGVMLIVNNPDFEPPQQQIAFTVAAPGSLQIGDTLTNPILAQSAPGSGELSYSSSNIEVATVDDQGTVVALAGGETTITATKAADAIYPLSVASYILNVDSPMLSAPILAALGLQTFILGEAIAALRLSNEGGGELSACSAESLPDGLTIAVSADLRSCELSGTPQAVLPESNFTVTATNAAGSSSAVLVLAVSNIPPQLVQPEAVIYNVNAAITPLRIDNVGGQRLTNCISDTLPAGLSVAVTEDRVACQISGIPEQPQPAAEHRITASNAAGVDSQLLSIQINNIAPQLIAPAAQTFNLGQAIAPLLLENTGGVNLSQCAAEMLPAGLTVSVAEGGRTCEITGTPLETGLLTASIFATNEEGSSEVAFAIDIPLLPPQLAANTEVRFVIRTDPATLISNSGGPIEQCYSTQGLPDGLRLDVSGDGQNCILTGTSLALMPPSTFEIGASNAVGADTATLSLEVISSLSLTTAASKNFIFDWQTADWSTNISSAVGNILQRLDGFEEFSLLTQVPIGSPMPTVLRDVPLFEQANAEYVFQTCMDGETGACLLSDPVFVRNEDLLPAIGYVKADNTDAGDHFGYSVSVSGNGQFMAVGAPSEGSAPVEAGADDNSEPSAGAVYVYRRLFQYPDATWELLERLKAPNGEAGDRFGEQLALNFDGSVLAVGAPGEDGGSAGTFQQIVNNNRLEDAGAVYAFVRDTRLGAFRFDTYIKASNPAAGDRFGTALALGGNTLDLSGVLVVGAPNQADGGPNEPSPTPLPGAGAIYVLNNAEGIWLHAEFVKASNVDAGDNFGSSVAISDDGFIIAVGAPGEASAQRGINVDARDNSASDAGAVYLFDHYLFDAVVQRAYIKASNASAGDRFGSALALAANGTRLTVGAPQEDSSAVGVNGEQGDDSAENAGAAYVFSFINAWQQDAYIKADNSNAGDQFGASVSLAGEGELLVVGAPFERGSAQGINEDGADNASMGAGAAYTFRFATTQWQQQAYIKAPNTDANDNFGRAVSFNAGGTVLLIGAPGEASASRSPAALEGDQADNAADMAGAAYLY